MPVAVSEIRAKFPMYDKVPEDQLILALHKKYYSDIPFKDFNANILYDVKPDATEGMTPVEKFNAGIGKALVDTVRGIGQLTPFVSRQDVADSRRLDSDLMNTTEGKIGNFAGNVATTVPLAFVPGANTMKGAALIGAAQGMLAPSVSTGETLQNAAVSGAAGPAGLAVGRGLGAGYQAVSGAVRPFFKSGQQGIASEVLRASATDPANAAKRLSAARELVPGSSPTVGQVSGDEGLAQLERTMLNNPETAGPLNARYAVQLAARRKAVADVAGSPEYRNLIEQGRNVFGKEDYAKALADGLDVEMAKAMKPQIDNLLQRPSIRQAQSVAKRLAAEEGISLKGFGSLEGLDWLKKALDNQISKAAKPGTAVGDAELRAMLQTKSDLMKTLEQIAPGYKVANDNYAAMSKQVNAMEVAADLQKRLYKNAEYGSGKEMAATYQDALGNAVENIKKLTGMNKSLSDVMPTRDIAALEAVAQDLVRKERGQNLGRAVGSPTMQNMISQNLLQRLIGPLGLPQTFAQNTLANTVARPFGYLAKSAEPRISAVLAEAMADPKRAAELLKAIEQPSRMGLLGSSLEKYSPVAGLLAAESGR